METNKNHMIAEFMGLTYEEKILVAPHGSQQEIKYNVYFENGNEITVLKYDTSWDALMPVINRINEVYEDIELDDENIEEATELANEIYEAFLDPDIELSYPIVVQFIELYNKIDS